MTEQELVEEIAEWLEEYYPKHNTTESGWVIIPEVAKERYKQDADQIHTIYKEAGYMRIADIVGFLHRQGNLWTDRKYELIEAIERIAGGKQNWR